MRIALSLGEPAGIGPDIVLKLADASAALASKEGRSFRCYADPDLLAQRARLLGLDFSRLEKWAEIVPIKTAQPVEPGVLNSANSPYVLECLRRACQDCLSGECGALVTGPVHKAIVNQAGIPFSGHTEFLAELTATAQVVMMLATPDLRVALATTHLPLAEVSKAITRPGLEKTLRILEHDLRVRFGLKQPRILVCGLNPHAGEDGHLGREELEILSPVLAALRAEGFTLIGPLPADTAFTPAALAQADVVLAMYHDQGLPVLKARGFGEAVNITLGLPIIRTSVDHGTALSLAGTGKAEWNSLQRAIDMAGEMAALDKPA
jgi:4-hydroxythreonine-4-phosphate dehydrogenase